MFQRHQIAAISERTLSTSMSVTPIIIVITPWHGDRLSLDQVIDNVASKAEAAEMAASKIANRPAPDRLKAQSFAWFPPNADQNRMCGGNLRVSRRTPECSS